MSGSALFLGQGGANPGDGASVWQLANGADDLGTPFDIYAMSNWIRPGATYYTPQAMAYAFHDAYVTVSWSMSVTLRFKAILEELPDVIATPIGTLEILLVDLPLVAPASGRSTRTFRIPLKRMIKGPGGTELGRQSLVGRAVRLVVSSVGGLGLGDVILSGAEIEHEAQEAGERSEG